METWTEFCGPYPGVSLTNTRFLPVIMPPSFPRPHLWQIRLPLFGLHFFSSPWPASFPARINTSTCRRVLQLLRVDKILHPFETMRSHCVCVGIYSGNHQCRVSWVVQDSFVHPQYNLLIHFPDMPHMPIIFPVPKATGPSDARPGSEMCVPALLAHESSCLRGPSENDTSSLALLQTHATYGT